MAKEKAATEQLGCCCYQGNRRARPLLCSSMVSSSSYYVCTPLTSTRFNTCSVFWLASINLIANRKPSAFSYVCSDIPKGSLVLSSNCKSDSLLHSVIWRPNLCLHLDHPLQFDPNTNIVTFRETIPKTRELKHLKVVVTTNIWYCLFVFAPGFSAALHERLVGIKCSYCFKTAKVRWKSGACYI